MDTAGQSQPSLHLEEVWKQRSNTDSLSSAALLMHHARLAFLYLLKSPLTSLLSVCCVAVVLFILGLLSSLQNASLFGVNMAAGQLQMSVFVRDDCSDQDWKALEDHISELPGLQKKRRLDKPSALAELRNILSDSPELLAGLEEDNPLPASFELGFDVSHGQHLAVYADQLRQKPGVQSVVYDGQLVQMLSDLAASFRGLGRIGLLVLGGLALFLVASTIRLSLFHESDEIEIMSLVGAYPGFIQAPFVIGGAMQGVCGAVLASAALMLAENRFSGFLRSEELIRQASLNFSLVSSETLLVLFVLGTTAGVAGSYLASRKFR